jgi:hypothetical protein
MICARFATPSRLLVTLLALSLTVVPRAAGAYTYNAQPGTVVHTTDIIELRSAANALRASAGLQAFAFTDPSLQAGFTIRAVHISELRTAIAAARASLAMPAVTYTDPNLTAGTTAVKAVHILELRTAAQAPASGGGPTNPPSQGGRHVYMMSPTPGETFWAPTTSLRLVAQGFDPNVFTNEPVDGKGQNAAQVAFYVDGTPVLTVSGADAEYSVFKGMVQNLALTPGQHLVWARATYVNPALVLDSLPAVVTVQNRPAYGQTIDLAQDIVLSAGNPTYQLQGTANAPIRLNGNGFQIRGTGTLTLRYVDVSDLGSRTDGLAPGIDVNSSTAIVIENSTFDSSNQVALTFTGTATASIRGNTFRSNSRIPIGQLPYGPSTIHIIEIDGNSTGTKTFAGNNVAAAAVGLTNAKNWTLGGTTDADSNVLIGARCAFEVQSCMNVTIERNFVRNIYYGGWSQGQLMELHDSTPITVRHNILIGSSWPVRGIAGELAYNVISDGGHESVVPDANANIHHNLFIGCGGPDGGDCNGGIIGGIYNVANVRVVNNTFDALGKGSIVAGAYIQQGSSVVRSNAFVNMPTLENVPTAAFIDLEPGATIDADYNAFHGPRLKNYGDNRVPLHDLPGRPNLNFTGPLPTEAFDMDQKAVWSRQLSVATLLADYRARYTPAAGSPLIDSGDPAGGAGNDIGAIGAGTANGGDLFGMSGDSVPAAGYRVPMQWPSAMLSRDPGTRDPGPEQMVPGAGSRVPMPLSSAKLLRDLGTRDPGPGTPLKIEPQVVYSNLAQTGELIRGADIVETRAAANELRSAAGLPPFTFTQPSLGGMLIRALHITELRTAVDEARTALGLPAMTYTDPTIVPGVTMAKAAHLNELRTAVVLPGGGSLLNPTRPQNLFAAGISPTTVFLKWSPSVSPTVPAQAQGTITGYKVFRDGALIATVTNALRYQDGSRQPNTTYNYSVIAVDNSARLSPTAGATATTLPTLPVGGASVHPVLFPAGKLAALAAGGSAWNSQKQFCDSNLNTIMGAGYAGWDWHDAAVSYSTCYQVAKLQGDTANALKYSKKALALAVVLARHHNQGTPTESDQTIGFTNGATTTFPLPFTPMNAAQVKVKLVATNELQVTRQAQGSDDLNEFAPIMKVANVAGGAAAYAPSDYELRFRDGTAVWRLVWLGANKPANGATYFVTVANGNATNVANGFTVNSANLTLTFNVAPAPNQAVMVSYLGTAYEQTGNGLGGVNSVQPDGPGYPMRTFNPGLASAYDALLDSSLLTPALKAEFYGIMNKQVDWCTNYCYENSGTGGEVGNYFIRGLFGGTFATAYATDGDNPLAAQLKAQANTQLAQVYEGVVKFLPGGYGPQGQYANGTTNDIMELMSLYRDVTGVDLLARLDWTNNVVPATIHATKPNLQTFYDGGDWDDLPAPPLDSAMQAFLQFQPNHANAPFARKLIQELGETPASAGTTTDYRLSYPLSFFGQSAPFYARSDWGGSAVWMSLTSNDTGAVAHQHRDAGHLTIQRGADYLLKNAGGYGFDTTLYHNTLLIDDRNIGGYTPVIVYPPGQGWWGSEAQLTKHAEAGAYAYVQADFAPAYLNNDGVRNSVKRALRSAVLLRPGTIVVFDQIQTAHAAIKKTFNANFGGTLTNTGGIWSTTVGQSKLFMQPLLTNAVPVVTSLPGGNNMTSANFQETISGNLKDVFLHLFQATSSGTGAMTSGLTMKSVDRNVQGVEVAAGGKTWAVLFAAYDRAFAGNVQYLLPTAVAHTHLVHDLLPLNAYVVSVTTQQGQLIRSFRATTDQNGVLTFDTPAGETYFYVTPGTAVPGAIPPVAGDPNV